MEAHPRSPARGGQKTPLHPDRAIRRNLFRTQTSSDEGGRPVEPERLFTSVGVAAAFSKRQITAGFGDFKPAVGGGGRVLFSQKRKNCEAKRPLHRGRHFRDSEKGKILEKRRAEDFEVDDKKQFRHLLRIVGGQLCGRTTPARQRAALLRYKIEGEECRVLMREDDAESQSGLRQIILEVLGEPQYRKFALRRVRDEVDELHRRWFRSIHADEMVPCCCEKCQFVEIPKLYKLEELLELRQESDLKQCTTGKMVPIQKLLEGIYDRKEISVFSQREMMRQ